MRRRHVRHGHTRAGSTLRAEYMIWWNMLSRCSDPRVGSFPRYGGRGIRVCARWLNSLDAFLADMGPRPSARHSIDRIDNDGHYEPQNCRWATAVEQANNRSLNARVVVRGEALTISEAARRAGMNMHTLWRRLERGMSADDAVTTAVRPYARRNRKAALRPDAERSA